MSLPQDVLEDATPKRPRRRGCFIALAVFAVLFAGYAWMFFSDVGPVDDSDLCFPPTPAVPDEENAAYWWGVAMADLESTKLIDFWYDVFLGKLALEPGGLGIEERESLQTFVNANEHRFNALLRAARCKVMVHSIDQSHWTTLFTVEELAAVGVQHALIQGDRDRAIEILHACRSIQRKSGPMPWILMPLQIITLWDHLIQTETDPAKLREWLRWHDDPIIRKDWVESWTRASYEYWRRNIDDLEWIFSGTIMEDLAILEDFCFRPLRTRAHLAEMHREFRDRVRRGEAVAPLPEPGFWKHTRWALGGNYAGDAFVQMVFEGPDDPIANAGLTSSRDALLRTAIALRIALLERGEYPATLVELVPDVLSSVPRDPTDPSGAPLRWDRERRVLWSVGSDGIDHGGPLVGESRGSILEITPSEDPSLRLRPPGSR